MKAMKLRGRWLLLTGASSGLGKEMARVLARDHGVNLILVARRKERLDELATELKHEYGIGADVMPADLSQEAEAVRVFYETTKNHELYGAILNAGVTHFGHHDELAWEDFQNMLSVNVLSVTRLVTLLLPYLEQRGEEGGLMLVASMAGLTPVAYQTAYSATKAFLVNYGCGLHHEMLPRGVSVTTFAPGGIATEMTEGQRFNDLRSWLMPADKCAEAGVKAFVKREYLNVPGVVYRWGSRMTKLLPQRFLVGTVAAQYRRSLDANR